MASILNHLLSYEVFWVKIHPEKRTAAEAFAPQVAGFAMFNGISPSRFDKLFVDSVFPFLVKLSGIGKMAIRPLGVEEGRINEVSTGENIAVGFKGCTGAVEYMAVVVSTNHSLLHHLAQCSLLKKTEGYGGEQTDFYSLAFKLKVSGAD